MSSYSLYDIICLGAASICLSTFAGEIKDIHDLDGIRSEFQAYLETSPKVKNMIVRYRDLRAPENISADQRAAITNTFRNYQISWVSDDFFIRQFENEPELNLPISTNGVSGLFAGRQGERFWHINNTNLAYSYISQIVTTNRDPIRAFDDGAEQMASSILGLGINNLQLGSVRWSQAVNDFSASTRHGQHISGTVSWSNGLPQKLSYTVGNAPKFRFECDYGYISQITLRNGIPNHSILTKVSGMQRQPIWEFFCLQYEPASGDLPPEHFKPERFIQPGFKSEIVWTNGSFYEANDGAIGRRILSVGDLAHFVPQNASDKSRRFLLVLLVLVSGVVLVIFVKLKNSTQAPKARK